MSSVIKPKQFENYTIESIPVEFETHQSNETEVYKVSEHDTQTVGGTSTHYEVNTDVIDMLQVLRVKDKVSRRNRMLGVARSSTRV